MTPESKLCALPTKWGPLDSQVGLQLKYVWFIARITIVTGVYKPTYKSGGPHSTSWGDLHSHLVFSEESSKGFGRNTAHTETWLLGSSNLDTMLSPPRRLLISYMFFFFFFWSVKVVMLCPFKLLYTFTVYRVLHSCNFAYVGLNH